MLVLRAVQGGGQVHTACLHASIAVGGRYAGSTQAWPCTRLPFCCV